ncbi:hypothetical protein COT97_02780 [Candidatus Falkowbacteria bacterium CG10_big_fil_rev_8_21_14_0_10_39_11]|uniref:Uncharacterized protein n=1 Tax=Candidatus Falkowbacteria bacterium CG10_big_fil_rev_8_21_14_0_10_39_11 TaxID=1974565 RepID=A0A2H0V526_9BACT|nr:MAG: hypothetical protein COT97_02780 [Candidatus Falkowbacteria bacterium CG10_big_fil_rev_8_21_14_0_10_39_11]
MNVAGWIGFIIFIFSTLAIGLGLIVAIYEEWTSKRFNDFLKLMYAFMVSVILTMASAGLIWGT